jgi:hypothetical protein
MLPADVGQGKAFGPDKNPIEVPMEPIQRPEKKDPPWDLAPKSWAGWTAFGVFVVLTSAAILGVSSERAALNGAYGQCEFTHQNKRTFRVICPSEKDVQEALEAFAKKAPLDDFAFLLTLNRK